MLPFGYPIRSNGSSRRLVRIGTIELDRSANPAVGLVDQPELPIVEANRAERPLGEIEDFVAVGRPFAGQ